jgi:hypothetical protein
LQNKDFWEWSINKLSTGLRANEWYNGDQAYGLAGYLNDVSSRMIGYATLRQLRVKNGKIQNQIYYFLIRKFILLNFKVLVHYMVHSRQYINIVLMI